MKSMIVVALALVAVAAALPVEDSKSQIIQEKFEQQPEGYKFEFASDNGIQRVEEGQLKVVQNEKNEPQNVIVVRGSYSFINDDGVQETITYEADENGFRPQGPSIPQPPARR